MSKTNPPTAMSLDDAKKRLAKYLAANSSSSVAEIASPMQCVAVKSPWGEEAIAIPLMGTNVDALIDALNEVILPERFTAIWHSDASKFEIIYTAYPLPREVSDLETRQFVFRHLGQDLKCGFGASSERLMAIAESFLPAAPSHTSYRNLGSFRNYILAERKTPGFTILPDAKPISFWVEGMPQWDDEAALGLVNHLNFYMAYYDNMSPQIYVHSPPAENVTHQPQKRFSFDTFPKAIKAASLDDNLLHFWGASRTGDPARRFIYNYQILEYASFYCIEEHIKHAIRKTLAAPNAIDNIEDVTARVVELVSETKITDPQKIENLLRQAVDPRLIWNEIENNLGAFTAPMTFDGGFVVQPIARLGWGVEDFRVNWVQSIANSLRSIRNALSHGKEQRMMSVIMPTPANFRKLQSWVPIVAAAAREAIVYGPAMG